MSNSHIETGRDLGYLAIHSVPSWTLIRSESIHCTCFIVCHFVIYGNPVNNFLFLLLKFEGRKERHEHFFICSLHVSI